MYDEKKIWASDIVRGTKEDFPQERALERSAEG